MDTSQAHSNHFGLYNLSNLWPTKATFRHFHLSLSLNPLKRRNFGYNKLLFTKSWTVFEVYPFVSSTLGIWKRYSQLAKLLPFSLHFPISHFQHISAFFITYSQLVSFTFLLHHFIMTQKEIMMQNTYVTLFFRVTGSWLSTWICDFEIGWDAYFLLLLLCHKHLVCTFRL